MKRIATAVAVAALAVGASATTASARVCCDDPGDTVATPTLVKSAHPAKKPVKKTAKKKDARPTQVTYLGRH